MILPENILTPIGNLRGALTSGGLIPGVPVIIGEASGNPAHFTDGTDNFLINLIIDINPVQSGSGDPSPSNPRPISGWTEAEIHVADGATPHIIDNIYNISWSEEGTIYGGKLNVLSGELTNTNRLVKLSDLTWQNWGSGGRFFASISSNRAKGSSGNNACECYKKEPNDSTSATMIDKSYVIRETAIYIKNSDYDNDLPGFINSLGDFKITYELLTPSTIYQTTPTQVRSIQGTNNIWTDTGNISDCKYIVNINIFLQWIYDNLYTP